MDQAQSLREYMHRFNVQQQDKHVCRVITVTSGKGGVGKSNFTLNFALGLQAAGKKVVVLDLDLSTANINILMGASSRYSLKDVLYKRMNIWDVIEKGSGGIEYIAGGLEIEDLLVFDQTLLSYFWDQIQELQAYADFILLDTGAGISKELIDFILASDETILVTTPEPTAIADSYAVLKTVCQMSNHPTPLFRLVVNRAHSYREAAETSRTLKTAGRRFLELELNTLGFMLEDHGVRQSVKSQIPFYILYPHCEAAKNIKQMVNAYLPDISHLPSVSSKGIRSFFERILFIGKSL